MANKKRATKGKRGRPAKGERKAFTMRLPIDLVDAADEEARSAGLSRVQFIERCIKYGVAGAREVKGEGGGLFAMLQEDLEQTLEDAFKRAMREGGMDLALYRLEGVKKKAKKGAKKGGGR